MLSLSGNVINLSRGNSGTLNLMITARDGSSYSLYPGDKLIFVLKKNSNDAEELIHKEMVFPVLEFFPEDTVHLEPGDYKYDVTLVQYNGTITTITQSDFNLMEVVRNG